MERHLKLLDGEEPDKYDLHTPEGRANRAEFYKKLGEDALMDRLRHRLERFCKLVEVKAPAMIMEDERALIREAFEALMSRGQGRRIARG